MNIREKIECIYFDLEWTFFETYGKLTFNRRLNKLVKMGMIPIEDKHLLPRDELEMHVDLAEFVLWQNSPEGKEYTRMLEGKIEKEQNDQELTT